MDTSSLHQAPEGGLLEGPGRPRSGAGEPRPWEGSRRGTVPFSGWGVRGGAGREPGGGWESAGLALHCPALCLPQAGPEATTWGPSHSPTSRILARPSPKHPRVAHAPLPPRSSDSTPREGAGRPW